VPLPSATSVPRTKSEREAGAASITGDEIRERLALHLAVCDPILHSLMQERNEHRREELIETILVEHLDGIIRRTLQRRLRRMPRGGSVAASVDDIRSTVFLKLLKRLRAFPANGPIQNLAAYAATITVNAWEDSLREAFPQRALLKNRIRYALLRDGRFALWHAGEQMLSGFAEWQGRTDGDTEAPEAAELRSHCPDMTSLAEVLFVFFRITGAPVELEAVVRTVAMMSGITDEPTAPQAADDPLVWSEPIAVDDAEDRETLRKIWSEILALNLPQRVAFLLNLRDDAGDAATPLFLATGVATIEEIAAGVGMPARDFAALWRDLPIEDAVIARILGVTRQRVINLRSAARKRLARRMRRF
jgi:DNA-directed RNA polymerase specialized sigma24 family protein